MENEGKSLLGGGEEEEEIPNYNFSKVVSGSAELVPPLALSAFVTNIPHPPAATEARW